MAYRTASGSNKSQVSCYVLEAMNVGYVTAFAVLAGAALGALTSFAKFVDHSARSNESSAACE